MTPPDQPEPALSAKQWDEVRAASDPVSAITFALIAGGQFPEWAKIVAVANDALPDSDARKITRLRLLTLRSVAETHRDELGFDPAGAATADAAFAFLDALESYLPPAP